jgi:flagellar biosynthesis protein FlhG
MVDAAYTKQQRAMVIAVCSGKGGVGKSTMAILIASRLASAGKNTLLIDADFGMGDIATMTNLTPLVGFEQMLTGEAELTEAVLRFSPKLSIIGTLPGAYLESSKITEKGLYFCQECDSRYDVIVIDTPSTIDPLTIGLIAGSDLALTVVTSRIPSIADSYVQLKRITQSGGRAKIRFLVNQVDSEIEGDQTTAKFGELVARFLGHRIQPLGMVEDTPQITRASEGQALLELTRQPDGFGRKAEKMLKTLLDKSLSQPLDNCSIWEHLKSTFLLRSEIDFDDTKLLARV